MSSHAVDKIRNIVRCLFCGDNADIDQYDDPPPHMGTGYTLDQEAEFPEENHIFGTSIPPPLLGEPDTWDVQSSRTPFENYYYDVIEEEGEKEGEEEEEEDEQGWGESSSLSDIAHDEDESSEIQESDNEPIDEKDLNVDSPHPDWDYDEYGLNKIPKDMKGCPWEGVQQLAEDDQWARKLLCSSYLRNNTVTHVP